MGWWEGHGVGWWERHREHQRALSAFPSRRRSCGRQRQCSQRDHDVTGSPRPNDQSGRSFSTMAMARSSPRSAIAWARSSPRPARGNRHRLIVPAAHLGLGTISRRVAAIRNSQASHGDPDGGPRCYQRGDEHEHLQRQAVDGPTGANWRCATSVSHARSGEVRLCTQMDRQCVALPVALLQPVTHGARVHCVVDRPHPLRGPGGDAPC